MVGGWAAVGRRLGSEPLQLNGAPLLITVAATSATPPPPPFFPAHQVNYFLHSGHLGIEGLKMSKSLKNFITIR